MAKKLCKFRKEVVAQLSELESLVSLPKFACQSCARVANSAENLCSAVPMGMSLESQVALRAESSSALQGDAVQLCTPPSLSPEPSVRIDKKAAKETKKQAKKSKKLAKKLKKLQKNVAASQKQLDKAQRRLEKGVAIKVHAAEAKKSRQQTTARLH